MADEPWEGESVEPRRALDSTCISTLVNFESGLGHNYRAKSFVFLGFGI